MNRYDAELMKFIRDNPSPYHIAESQAKRLREAGYEQLAEEQEWSLRRGGSYFVMRNGSALIAFRIPAEGGRGFRIAASHSDCPRPKLKENPAIGVEKKYVRLNTEIYGGTIYSTWLDRPLSVAGRICVREGAEVRTRTVDLKKDLLMIPNLAIHMNREVNKGYVYNPQTDLLPLYALGEDADIMDAVAEAAGVKRCDILGSDLYVYNRQEPLVWGAKKEFLSAPGLDDAQCAFSSLEAFLSAGEGGNVPVHALFDNEEVGSSSIQGAASTFLFDTLNRICSAGVPGLPDYRRMVAASFLLSADNAHALHPNHPEKCDPVNRPVPGGGVVVKFSANQKYTTDARSAAEVRMLAEKAGARLQVFTNRADIPGGSTLGNISSDNVPVLSADVGLAQLAMHSSFETCGCGDTEEMVRLMKANFEV